MSHDPYCDGGLSPCNCTILKAAREDTRQETWWEALTEAIRIIETHRIQGYFCSCGSEVNAEYAHHTKMIKRSRDGDAANSHDALCAWSTPCIHAETKQHSRDTENPSVPEATYCWMCGADCLCELIKRVREEERVVKAGQ